MAPLAPPVPTPMVLHVTVNVIMNLHIQWTLSIADTIGTHLSVLYREVSLIQRWFCSQFYVVRTAGSVLIREVSSIQGVLYWEVLL